MKYLILVPDGAGDEKIEALGDKTPLEVADIETINGVWVTKCVGIQILYLLQKLGPHCQHCEKLHRKWRVACWGCL